METREKQLAGMVSDEGRESQVLEGGPCTRRGILEYRVPRYILLNCVISAAVMQIHVVAPCTHGCTTEHGLHRVLALSFSSL